MVLSLSVTFVAECTYFENIRFEDDTSAIQHNQTYYKRFNKHVPFVIGFSIKTCSTTVKRVCKHSLKL